jgi:hypothetical protein
MMDSLSKNKLKPKRGNRKVMFGSALKELEDKYQEERSERQAPASQARNKSETKRIRKAQRKVFRSKQEEGEIEATAKSAT